MHKVLVSLIAAAALFASTVHAELPLIRLDRIVPLGGQAGAEVTLEIAGRDLEEAQSLHFDHPGLKAQWIKANQFRIAIADGTPPGTYEVRAVGKFGISGARLFSVQRGLTEIAEKEPNDEAGSAQPVPMNCVINGTSDNNGDDFYRFAAKKGERITIDCQAYRLDSMLTPMLTLATADGKDLMQSRPYYHRTDPFLDFIAPADGDYLVRVHDMTFRGGLPYRLIISHFPQIEQVYPMAIVPGAKTELTLLGRNLPGSQRKSPWKIHEDPLEELAVSITVPTDAAALQRFSFQRHMPTPGLNARGVQIWPEGLKNVLNPITLTYAHAPITLDREPNDTAETAQPITLPTVICGRFDRPGDADWFVFSAKAGQTFEVDLLCERLELPGDPYVIVFDHKGNEVASFDDHGVNFNALNQFNRDPVGTFRIPADGQYRLFVQERYRNGGARYQYVLNITTVVPDFFPVVFHETANEPSCPTVHQGGSAFYELCLNRRNYTGPVVIEAEGLPTGVSCPPIHVSPQGQFANVVFTAAADAPFWSGAIRLKSWAIIDGKRLEREVRATQRRWPIANISASVMLREICLAVRGPAPYGIRLPESALSVPAGGTLETTAKVTRLWPEFKGPVQLKGLNLPPGFGLAAAEIGPERTESTIKLTVAANVPPGEYSVVLRGDAQVPYQRDAKAASRPQVRVADPSTPLRVLVLAKVEKK